MLTNIEFVRRIAEEYKITVSKDEYGYFVAREEDEEGNTISIHGFEDRMTIFIVATGRNKPSNFVNFDFLPYSNIISGNIKSIDPVWESWKKDVIGTLGW